MILIKKPALHFSDVQVFPDLDKKALHVKIKLSNSSGREAIALLNLSVSGVNLPPAVPTLPAISKKIVVQKDTARVEIDYPMGDHPLLWDEFHPNLYSLHITVSGANGERSGANARESIGTSEDKKEIDFGMRAFVARGE